MQQRHAIPGPPLSISPPGIDPYASAPPSSAYPSPQRVPRRMQEPIDDEDDLRGVQSRPAAMPPPAARPLPALGPPRDPADRRKPLPERFDLGMITTIVAAAIAFVSAFYLPRPLLALISAAARVASGGM